MNRLPDLSDGSSFIHITTPYAAKADPERGKDSLLFE
jgi:hypothetical protein